jgi:hypothetical protein
MRQRDRIVHEETMCCGFKKCPTLRIFASGRVELTDDDAKKGSVGTIKLSKQQARLLGRRLDR